MDILSVAAGFLVGVAATYLLRFFLSSDTQTQTAKFSGAKSDALFESLWRAHQKLFDEIQRDLNNPDFQFHREFSIEKKGWNWNRFGFHRHGPCLVYFIEDHIDLPGQLDNLASKGLITRLDEKKHKFQLSERLVEWLRRKLPVK